MPFQNYPNTDLCEPLLCRSQIPTCLVTTGLTGTAYGPIIDVVASRTMEHGSQLMIKLTPSLCPNLKSALKNIIHVGTSAIDSDDEALPVARQVCNRLNDVVGY